MNLRIGNLTDADRLTACIGHLFEKYRDSADVIHSINVNGFVAMALCPYPNAPCHIMIRRKSDSCLLYESECAHDETIPVFVERMVLELEQSRPFTKCLVCDKIATPSGYCTLCSLIQTQHHEVCAICLEDQKSKAVWVQLPCFHIFHYHCMKQSMEVQPSCPLCRAECESSTIEIY
jgi:hypothetical protein